MIKSHLPRGYQWTCASKFQQTKQFREIKFGDCTTPPAKVLLSDPDDDRPLKERASKRRKIEQLADDYLNGVMLHISSARPCPSALKSIIEWNQRSRKEAKYHLSPSHLEDSEDTIWVDLTDDWDQHAPFHATAAGEGSSRRQTLTEAEGLAATVTKDQAWSSCRSAEVRKVVRVNSQPSKQALQQASELHARGLQRAATEEPAMRTSTVSDSRRSNPHIERDSTLWMRAQPHHLKTSRLSPPDVRLNKAVEDDDSADELRCSHEETPTRRPKSLVLASYEEWSAATGTSEESDDRIDVVASIERGPLNSRLENIGDAGLKASESSVEASAHTVLNQIDPGLGAVPCLSINHVDDGPEFVPQESPPNSQEDSQTTLLREQGIRAAPRKSWTAMNGNTASAESGSTSASTSGVPLPVLTLDSALRRSLQESAAHAGKPKKAKRARASTKSATQATSRTTRRGVANQEPQNVRAEMSGLSADQQRHMSSVYTAADVGQDGSTPFVYRKRNTTTGGKTAAELSNTSRQKSIQRSSEASNLPAGYSIAMEQLPIAAEAPQLDISLSYDSSFAPKLNMALVEEHMNSILPAEQASAGRSSALKKAIRHEMRSSGADLFRAHNLPPSSLGEQEHCVTAAAEEDTIGPLDEVAPAKQMIESQWPGTQALLHRAERDFFSSPVKQPDSNICLDMGPSSVKRAGSEPASAATRPPLRELSQKQLSGTQTMIESWSPWSTVKKPVTRPTSDVFDSPSTLTRGAQKSATASAIDGRGKHSTKLSETIGRSGRQRSSLHYSMSTAEPEQSSRIDFPTRKQGTLQAPVAKPTADTPNFISTENTFDPFADGPTGVEMQGASAISVALSDSIRDNPTTDGDAGFGAAQLEREDSELGRTMEDVEDLTEYLMRTTKDVESVMSQC